MIYKEMKIANPNGLKARVAANFVQVAGKFESQILVECENKKINAKSIMGVLSLGIKQDEEICVIANGKDEAEAIEALEEAAKLVVE